MADEFGQAPKSHTVLTCRNADAKPRGQKRKLKGPEFTFEFEFLSQNCPREHPKAQVTGLRHSAALENGLALHTQAQTSDFLNHRVGVIRAIYVQDILNCTHAESHHGCNRCADKWVTAHCVRHCATDSRHQVTDSSKFPPSARTMAAQRTHRARRPPWRR